MWCFHDIEYSDFYARRIRMPKSFTGKELMYTSIVSSTI
jgi:hypothetical protein